ncbi:MAG: hypothetical protein WCJ74_00400 [bacterium]
MYQPTKKTLYILIACILFLAMLVIAKNQTDKNFGPISLETSSNNDEEIINTEDYNFVTGETDNSETQINNPIEANENLTESFSKNLFAKYYSGAGDVGLTDTDSQAFVDEAVSAYASISLGNAPQYVLSDLKIVKSTEANLRNFANTFAVKEASCLENIKRVAIGTEDPVQTGSLYKKCATDFVEIPIIQAMNEYYLNLVNVYYSMGEKIISLEEAKSDPLKALVLMKEISDLDNQKITYYQNISNLIINSGIIFNNEEPGKAWVGGTV